MNNSRACIYHANCFDGMGAYWAVDRAYPGIPAFPMHYGQPLPDVYDFDELIIVDFSLPRELMIDMVEIQGKHLLVLDHHKTAQANCEGLPFCIFDMNRSGAGMAWDHFHGPHTRPHLINYIEDRDLWKFLLPDSEAINAYIQSFKMELRNYNYLHEHLQHDFADARRAGIAIERYKESMVAAICEKAVLRPVGGYTVPTVNASLLFSEIGHTLCTLYPDYPFAASFFLREDGKIQYSLRSIGDFDVSYVARNQGGGGHKNAAGFESANYILLKEYGKP